MLKSWLLWWCQIFFPNHDIKMGTAAQETQVVVTFIDTLQCRADLSPIFPARVSSRGRKLVPKVCNSSQLTILLHHLQSVYLQGSWRPELKVGEFFLSQSSNYPQQVGTRSRRKQKVEKMKCVYNWSRAEKNFLLLEKFGHSITNRSIKYHHCIHIL